MMIFGTFPSFENTYSKLINEPVPASHTSSLFTVSSLPTISDSFCGRYFSTLNTRRRRRRRIVYKVTVYYHGTFLVFVSVFFFTCTSSSSPSIIPSSINCTRDLNWRAMMNCACVRGVASGEQKNCKKILPVRLLLTTAAVQESLLKEVIDLLIH